MTVNFERHARTMYIIMWMCVSYIASYFNDGNKLVSLIKQIFSRGVYSVQTKFAGKPRV